jgi:hypothetical protein
MMARESARAETGYNAGRRNRMMATTKTRKRQRCKVLTCATCDKTLKIRWRDGESYADALYAAVADSEWQNAEYPNQHIWYCCDAHV